MTSLFFDPLWIRFHDQYEYFKKLETLYNTVLKDVKDAGLFAEINRDLANVCLMLAEYAESIESQQLGTRESKEVRMLKE